MTKARIDWRKHDRNAPESTYVRLAQPGDILKFRSNPTPRFFCAWGIDRDAVIRFAETEAAKRISAELERLRIAAEQKANHTRFRIDSEHEFG